ncbi:polysaccharide deacetylase family protein [Sinorhizobium medicae]|uniref:Chitooligosaccharide deacetylase n=1 Tax=Sinorhizobium medicae (strain WSM419) TaxID=366394 RepID=A6U6T3_SINMW|nr:polysaccharide deacetylase family protein [Sinorhizobium medicae]ABR59363.1 polysaccharide deacetylase [Sinorhizobium medicae WSM419]MDX0477076.1 polysaccharide deacetylase family protein [Sinorhizobium medicae]MDX0835321.1 polysaccharide deacetylase family protein [Sinorhizobium medicae]MDX0895884.1 polysaccharide deacetylase family protein [Sinorhizobium medicae]MDX1042655.1 polysaccharide deacetylase family protein [Sinorhizobium medicae]
MKDGFAGLVRTHVKRTAISGGLEAAHLLARARLMGAARGRGAVFTLHHVRPKVPRSFDPNAHLEITPEFLEDAILTLKRDGYRFIPLDELPSSLTFAGTRPLACFTLDDGYRNNLDHALPVFERHGVPFTVFVTAGYAERTHTLWWETLAELLSVSRRFHFDFGTGEEIVASGSLPQKQAAFDRLATYIHESGEADAIAALNRAACEHGIDPLAITERLTLDEAGLRRLIRCPLASLGGHTISHRAIARLGDGEARREIAGSAGCVEAITGRRPSTFAYPYGDRLSVSPRDHRLVAELGISVAVTTQPAMLAETTNLHALPRISLNGHFQNARYVTALGSGIPFRLFARGAG